MSITWNLEETRQLIQKLYGGEQLELARPSLNSMIERRDHANIHWHNTRRLLDRFARHATTRPLFTIAFGAEGDTARDRYYWDLAKAQAYIIAIVQSLHSIPDICAHAIYYSLALDNGPTRIMNDRDINAKNVKGMLAATGLATLHNLYSGLSQGGEFNHLAAISNRSKHRSIVRPSLREDYTGTKDKVRLEFPAFTHGRVHYPGVPVREFTEREYNRCARLIVDIGNALNEILRERAQSAG
jgi:hypothetical protein